MNAHYFDMLLAFLIAQLLMASINVYTYQLNKSIDYWSAVKAYFKAEIGYFIIGLLAVCAVLFVLSDLIDLSVSRKDLLNKTSLTWKENLQLYFKTSALFIGAFVQYMAFKFKEKGKAAIDKAVDKG